LEIGVFEGGWSVSTKFSLSRGRPTRTIFARIVITEHISLGVTAEALRANIDRKSAFLLEQGQFGPKFRVQGSPTNHSSFLKNRIHVLSCCARMWAHVFRFVTIHTFDGQTDGRLSAGYTVRCITCSRTVKTPFKCASLSAFIIRLAFNFISPKKEQLSVRGSSASIVEVSHSIMQ